MQFVLLVFNCNKVAYGLPQIKLLAALRRFVGLLLQLLSDLFLQIGELQPYIVVLVLLFPALLLKNIEHSLLHLAAARLIYKIVQHLDAY